MRVKLLHIPISKPNPIHVHTKKMQPKIHLRFLPFILATLILLAIPVSVGQIVQPYQSCAEPFHCGSVSSISYPFWGGNRPLSCGFPGFEINCLGDEPLFNISSLIYRILAIDNSTQTLKISRNDLRDNLCPRFPSNTTLDFAIFDFYQPADDRNITLYYGCSADETLPFSPNRFGCNVNATNSSSFFVEGVASGPGSGVDCGGRISVRVNRTAAEDLANASVASASLLLDGLKSGFSIRWSAADIGSCDDCVRSGGLCGYHEDAASFACHCANGSYVSTCNGPMIVFGSKKGLSDLHKYVIIVTSLCISGLILSSIAAFYITKNRRSRDQDLITVDRLLLNHGSLAPKRYSYNKIKKITKSFREKLGQGGYGVVFKGTLDDGRPVAVKVLNEAHDNAEDFVNEVASISRTSHVNIVALLGFCFERGKRALIYEFMPNKSLDEFISVKPEWEKLYEIAVGVGQGLDYLHRGCSTRIVHFDIKPQNILLDQDMRPKISDFGLAKLIKSKQSIVSVLGARGTIGYIAPEIISRNFGVVSHKSDVYSYGMMLLEMAEVRSAAGIRTVLSGESYFADRIYEKLLPGNGGLGGAVMEEEARKMVLVGLWCIQTAPAERPSMAKVLEMLEGSVESVRIPPKPFLYSPTVSGQRFSSSFSGDTETEDSSEYSVILAGNLVTG